jgi:hypothetical protein
LVLDIKLQEAIVAELKRQADENPGKLVVELGDNDTLDIKGPVDLVSLVIAITGSFAGGP